MKVTILVAMQTLHSRDRACTKPKGLERVDSGITRCPEIEEIIQQIGSGHRPVHGIVVNAGFLV